LLAICVLMAFFFRDLRLLVAAGRSLIGTACAVYAVLFFLHTAALGALLSFAQIHEPNLITIDERVWVGVVGVHVVLCGLTWWMSSQEGVRRAWVVVLAPSPAVLLSLCFVVGALPDKVGISLGPLSLPLFGLIWIALIVPLAYEIVRGPLMSDRFLSIRSLRFVALLNLSSLLCFVDQFNL
jgi:glucan phosphoethanolaminetransferase (alkaline phosphatase superfamily)